MVILQPRCPQGCEHGSCTSPSTCTCEEVNISIMEIKISIMMISTMKITHDIIIRVGKEPTAQNEVVQEAIGARIACSSVSANMVRLVSILFLAATLCPSFLPNQVPPATLFLETAPAPLGTWGHSVSCHVRTKPLERVVKRSAPAQMDTTVTT